MTNTLNTPVEALELAYPFRLERYSLRAGSGGAGEHAGGDGIVREYTVLTPATVTMQSERRAVAPWGLAGGDAGAVGRNLIIHADGREEALPSKFTRAAGTGRTPARRNAGAAAGGEQE
jgi:N-methylhydantoinase B